jgi:peptide/nickel transport system permease protein
MCIVFFAVEALPGDACTAYLGRDAQGSRLENCRNEIGLNRPATVRFQEWATNAATGDLGLSLSRDEPVATVVAYRLRNTAFLGLSACLVGIPLAIALGVLAGLWRDRASDLVLSASAIVFMTFPEFVTGTLLLWLFAIWLKWLPGIVIAPPDAPLEDLARGAILPVVVLSTMMIAHIMRMVRTSVIEVMASDYIRMAILKGVPFWLMVRRHVLRNALVPTTNLIALVVAWMLGGLVIVESIFNYPGIGRLTVDAIGDRDIAVVQGIALVLSAVYVALNFMADMMTIALDPRIRTAKA